MFQRIFGHWKTTLFGLVLAGLQAAVPGANWKQLVLAFATGVLGAVAKDH